MFTGFSSLTIEGALSLNRFSRKSTRSLWPLQLSPLLKPNILFDSRLLRTCAGLRRSLLGLPFMHSKMLTPRLARSMFEVISVVIHVQSSKFAGRCQEGARVELLNKHTEKRLAVATESYCSSGYGIMYNARSSYVLDGEKYLHRRLASQHAQGVRAYRTGNDPNMTFVKAQMYIEDFL